MPMLRVAIPGLLTALVLLTPLSAIAQGARPDSGAAFAQFGCAGCHGPQGRGTALAPSLAGPGLSAERFRSAVRTARGAMPAFGTTTLSDAALASLHAYLTSQPAAAMPSGRAEAGATRYEQAGCYSCHSNQGQGGTQGPRLGPQPVRWGWFVWTVRHSAGQMPPYSAAVLTDQELADIHEFLATRPVPQPLADIPLLAP